MYHKYDGIAATAGWDDVIDWATTGTNYNHQKHFQLFEGYWNEDEMAGVSGQHAIILGCKTNRDITNANVDNDIAYGLCMRGWLQYISIESEGGRTGELTAEGD